MRQRSIVRWAPGLIAALVLGLIVTLAVRAIGYPVNKLDLNDSGIWVTNDAEALFGRLNKSAESLDGLRALPGIGPYTSAAIAAIGAAKGNELLAPEARAAGTTVSGMSADISIPVLPENRRQRIKKPAR